MTRSYAPARRRTSSSDRVLAAAEALIREDAYSSTTMEELAAAAGVSRATVFNRFGSKLGVLQALFTRCMQSPEMTALQGALDIEDPLAALDAVIDAACVTWEAHGFIHEQLQAIVVLEPDLSALVDQQRNEQRDDLQRLTRRLARAGLLRPGLGEARAISALHMLTSLESFLMLRREHGLSLRQTRETITELARTLLRP
ncbi:MAG TPA: TetR/AcrR family transcriptional regulator [Actinomycetes bacterium]|jgi:AcrR family transcriptional regulator|nr:TetR/AcrR family transcriptional regulator [Actinomycetes bacterium]